MFAIALMLAGQQAAPQVQPDRQPERPVEVVITGNRMREALNKCLARGCTPEEEVDAAMNAGAESFAAGQYQEAKDILRRAIARNKKYGDRMPGPLSDLYATYADVTEHEGDTRAFGQATRESVYVLRRALGPEHPLVTRASARIGDMWVKLGQPQSADSEYKEAAEGARRAGNSDMAAALTFRRAWLAVGSGDKSLARRLLSQLEQSHGADAQFAPVLRVLKARVAMAGGNTQSIDALVSDLQGIGGADPVLVYEPAYPVLDPRTTSGIDPNGGVNVGAAVANAMPAEQSALWADIGYWVRPDGKPSDIEILRPAKGSGWAKPLVNHIAKRRYMPLAQDARGVGSYRIERFTLRASFDRPTGSRIAQRVGGGTLHAVDLTRLAQRDAAPPQ